MMVLLQGKVTVYGRIGVIKWPGSKERGGRDKKKKGIEKKTL